MQMPSKIWTRSLSPSLIFTWTLMVSPGLKLGRSVRSCLFSTISSAFIVSPNSPINPPCFVAFFLTRPHAATCGRLHDRPKSRLPALSSLEILPAACSGDVPQAGFPQQDPKKNPAVSTPPCRPRLVHSESRRLLPLLPQLRR